MTTTSFPQQQYSDDVAVITLADKTILLVGTAHISQQSTDLVKKNYRAGMPGRSLH